MLKEIILRFQQRIPTLEIKPRHINTRELQEALSLGKIVALLGPRRAGKTWITYQLVQTYIQQNIYTIEQIVYIDMWHMLDKKITGQAIIEAHQQLFGLDSGLIIIDEVQELEQFPEVLLYLISVWYHILITGSNAHLLSKEISTLIRGKVYTKEIFPLDFKEFLSFKWYTLTPHDIIRTPWKTKKTFEEYLTQGGFPEITLATQDIVKENIIKDYLNVMIYKDLVDRYNIRNEYVLRYCIKRICSGFTKERNYTKVHNELKSQWIKVSKDTLHEYIYYLENVYFIDTISNRRTKIKWLKKPYIIDSAFLYMNSAHDIWKRLENTIYLHLRRKHTEIYFMKQTQEIDFYIPDTNTYIQITHTLTHNNKERELAWFKKITTGNKILIYISNETDFTGDETIQLIFAPTYMLGIQT